MKTKTISHDCSIKTHLAWRQTFRVIITSIIAAISLEISDSALAQTSLAGAPISTQAPPPSSSSVFPGTQRQKAWLAASQFERVTLSEKIGVEGADKYAQMKGYKPLLSAAVKATKHGPDAVYIAPDGKLVVLEAKGNGGTLDPGYGYNQGTPEHAVASAREMLKKETLPLNERSAYESVVENARTGNLRVETIRTRADLGEPFEPVLEKSVPCSPEACKLALAASEELNLGAKTMQRLLANGCKVVAKVGGAAGIVGGVLQATEGAQELRNGEGLKGSLDSVIGAGNSIAGSMLVIGNVPAGVTMGGATAIVDGGKDVVLGFMDGDTQRTVVGTIKIASGAGMCSGVPLLVVIGGVTYGGVWVFEHREAVSSAGKHVGHWAQSALNTTWNKGASTMDWTETTFWEVQGKVYSCGSSVAGSAEAKFDSVSSAVSKFTARGLRGAAQKLERLSRRLAED